LTFFEEFFDVSPQNVFLGAEVLYFGNPGTSFELDQSALNGIAARFAADNLQFCCAAPKKLCYDPCFPGGTVTSNGRCKCFPGWSGPNAVQIGWDIIADNCNTACVTNCFSIPAGQGAPAPGPCGPCVSGTSGNFQNPYNGVCYQLTTGTSGTTNGDNVVDYPGEPSCLPC